MKKIIIILLSFLTSPFIVNAQFGVENDISKTSSTPINSKGFDLDNDGDIDVLVGQYGYNVITWYENLGGGIFSERKVIKKEYHSGLIAINAVDIDSDGDFDILAIWDDKFVWFENLGNAIFGNEQIIQLGYFGTIASIEAYDLNLDNNIDLIYTVRVLDKTAWFENLGGNTFSNEKIISSNSEGIYDVSFGDIDNDGMPDVITASSLDDRVGWHKNLGNGLIDTVKQNITLQTDGPSSIYAGDVDLDGDIDIVSASYNDNKIALYKNIGSGLFTPQQIITSSLTYSWSVHLSDIDSDGDLDIITASGYTVGDGIIAWFENLGNGIFDTTLNLISNNIERPFEIVTSDFNNNGLPDILSLSKIDSKVVWFENLGNGSIDTNQNIISAPTLKEINSTFSVDLDLDGDNDLIVSSENDNKISWYENLGGGNFSAQQIITNVLKPKDIYAVDFDLDGDIDIIILTESSLYRCENLGNNIFGALTSMPIINSNGNTSVICADYNSDGFLDIIYSNQATDDIYILLHNGNWTFSQPVLNISSIINGPKDLHATDINNDGIVDIIIAAYNGDAIYLISSNLPYPIGISGNTKWARSVFAADLDNDGFVDVISASQLDDKIAWYKNVLGTIDTTQYIISNSDNNPWDVIAVDIDGDGDEDVVSAGADIFWHENLGGGNFGPPQLISQQSISSISSSDIDNDGDIDIFFGSRTGHQVGYFENYFGSQFQLKGKTFFDLNQNSILDTSERGLSFINLQVQPNGLGHFLSNNGNYFFSTDTGTHVVSYITDSLWTLTTDSNTFTRTLTPSNSIADSLNFGFYPDTLFSIIHPDLTGGFPRCNNSTNYWLNIQNIGTTIPSGYLHLQLDDSITYLSSNNIPDSINGQSIYWKYDTLFFHSNKMIDIQVQMPPFTNMGDTLSSYLTVYELDSNNNIIYSQSDTLNQILVCAYDPNDKSVTPKGIGYEGFISKNQKLEYLIRFQNTGNDTAITVIIKDQLDGNLNWNSFNPISSSDPVQIWMEQNGKATFKFNNIMLPDSGADFLGSQGFVKFSIEPKQGVLPKTKIFNNSQIFFDYNPAIVTNYTLNTIECYGTPQPNITYNFPYLNAGVTGNYSYQWYLNDTTIIQGATSDTLIPTINGDYSVEVTDSNYCSTKSAPYSYIAVNISELSLLNAIVFPNPFTSSTTILFDKTLDGIYDLLIYDIVGKQVQRINNITGNKIEINKKNIGTGLFLSYLVNNKTGEKIFIEKLIIQ